MDGFGVVVGVAVGLNVGLIVGKGDLHSDGEGVGFLLIGASVT
jgi:hypothetical protein